MRFGTRILGFVFVAELVVGFVLASDNDHWQAYSVCAITLAALMTIAWRSRPSEAFEILCAMSWLMAAIVSMRWAASVWVIVPLLATSLIGLPFVFLAERKKWLAGHRGTRHLCPECGYDIRASKERCPECGTLFDPDAERRRRLFAELKARRAAPSSESPAEHSRQGDDSGDDA